MKVLHTIAFYCLYTLMFLLSLLPMSLLYACSRLLSWCMYHIIGYRRDVVVQNISRSFPLLRYKEVQAISRKFYTNLSDNFVEIFKSMSAPKIRWKQRVIFKNFDIITQHIKDGKTVLAGLGHMTNWEILNILPQVYPIPTTAVYQTQNSPVMDRLMATIRSRFGMQLVTSKDIPKQLLYATNRNGLYLFIADQCPAYTKEDEKIIFLHQSTQVFNGLEKLALKVKAEVVYLKITRPERGLYEVECQPIDRTSNTAKGALTAAYAYHLEQNIIAQPEGWLWTHKRWKR